MSNPECKQYPTSRPSVPSHLSSYPSYKKSKETIFIDILLLTSKFC